MVMRNALYIVWDDANNLGIPIIDEQHRGIVATINSFHYFLQAGRGLAALTPTLDILEHYTFIHFKTEEELMLTAGYPGYKEHVLLHAELMRRTKEIARTAKLNREPEAALPFLKEWWLGHINNEDRLYSSYVRKELGIR